MYWYNFYGRGLTICPIVLLLFVSCTKPDVKESKGQFKYFDLKGFMRTDSARLSKRNPMVNKTVNHNGESETKNLKIANWGSELSLFTASDINKPSWRNSYEVINHGDTLIYKAKTPELKTRKLIISRSKDKITSVQVFNHTKNILYETSEELTYIPDSAYMINKNQHVILLGSNRYIIKGRFLK